MTWWETHGLTDDAHARDVPLCPGARRRYVAIAHRERDRTQQQGDRSARGSRTSARNTAPPCGACDHRDRVDAWSAHMSAGPPRARPVDPRVFRGDGRRRTTWAEWVPFLVGAAAGVLVHVTGAGLGWAIAIGVALSAAVVVVPVLVKQVRQRR